MIPLNICRAYEDILLQKANRSPEARFHLQQTVETKNLNLIVSPQSILFPNQINYRSFGVSEGGSLITTQTRPEHSEIIFGNPVYSQLGVTLLPDLDQKVSIPLIEESDNPSWLPDASSSVESEPSTGSVNLSPKHIGNHINVSKTLLAMILPGTSDLIVQELYAANNRTIDEAMFYGTGINGEPTGLVNTPGIRLIDGTSLNKDTLLNAIEHAEKNSDKRNMSWSMNPTTKRLLAKRSELDGTTPFLIKDGKMEGYPVISTPRVTTGDIFFGDFSTVVLGMFGKFNEMLFNPFTFAVQGITIIVNSQFVDIGFRNPKALIRIQNVS